MSKFNNIWRLLQRKKQKDLLDFFLAGDITQKGYEKKRSKLLLPFLEEKEAEMKREAEEKERREREAASAETTDEPKAEPKADHVQADEQRRTNGSEEATAAQAEVEEAQATSVAEASVAESSSAAPSSSAVETSNQGAAAKPRSRHRHKR